MIAYPDLLNLTDVGLTVCIAVRDYRSYFDQPTKKRIIVEEVQRHILGMTGHLVCYLIVFHMGCHHNILLYY